MYDASRHGTNVRTTMASDVRLVTATTKGNPMKSNIDIIFSSRMMQNYIMHDNYEQSVKESK